MHSPPSFACRSSSPPSPSCVVLFSSYIRSPPLLFASFKLLCYLLPPLLSTPRSSPPLSSHPHLSVPTPRVFSALYVRDPVIAFVLTAFEVRSETTPRSCILLPGLRKPTRSARSCQASGDTPSLWPIRRQVPRRISRGPLRWTVSSTLSLCRHSHRRALQPRRR